MAKKESLPIEVHDHFRKANKLHGYVEKALGEATKHALEIGQELLAAKATIPHGSWESECDRLFDGSSSNARFYMQFAKNMEALPKRQQSSVLFLEGTLKGAADAAKKAAGKKPPSRSHQEEPEDEEEAEEVIDVEFEPADDTGEDADSEGIPEEDAQGLAMSRSPDGAAKGKKCKCGADWWLDGACGGCFCPEDSGKDGRSPGKGKDKPAASPRDQKLFQAKGCLGQWMETVRHMMADPIGLASFREEFPGPLADKALDSAKDLFESLSAWKKKIS